MLQCFTDGWFHGRVVSRTGVGHALPEMRRGVLLVSCGDDVVALVWSSSCRVLRRRERVWGCWGIMIPRSS